jgi:hypothetical protein
MKFSRWTGIDLESALIDAGMAAEGDFLFNPSFVEENPRSLIVCLRKVSNAPGNPRSQLIFRVLNLGTAELGVQKVREFTELGGFRVRDMKLTKNHDTDEVYATFNTGHELRGNNVLLAKLSNLDAPQVLELRGRRRIEKNWAFFWREGNLFAIYSLFPLRVLRQVTSPAASNVIEMETWLTRNRKSYLRKWTSLGSQPIFVRGEILATFHYKPKFLLWRAYIPKLALIDFETARVRVMSFSLPKGEFSLHPSKLNWRAVAVNYASGLAVLQDKLILGLGQRDDSFKMFEADLEAED